MQREDGELPVDSDVDVHFPRQRRELPDEPWAVLAAISLGGALGACARYGVDTALPHAPDAFALSTLLVNVTGCLLIGVLMVLVVDVWPRLVLLRPLLGVGFLGGFTTFSTHIMDAHDLLEAGRAGLTLAFLGANLAGGLAAAWLGVTLATRATRLRRSGRVRR
ncbi:CrcB family protein [Nocardiopsis sp. EMB25]|uniref:fluoride efflux transporter FluC n=1 Tax=Nocardiopsis TaxID=2013 RepID=UPI00034A564C|nr:MULTISPECIES: CrcB family protein [Nocardiopsis]MCY9786370.1 CrcB family protein [Nocardiopsis sp. EMB25]